MNESIARQLFLWARRGVTDGEMMSGTGMTDVELEEYADLIREGRALHQIAVKGATLEKALKDGNRRVLLATMEELAEKEEDADDPILPDFGKYPEWGYREGHPQLLLHALMERNEEDWTEYLYRAIHLWNRDHPEEKVCEGFTKYWLEFRDLEEGCELRIGDEVVGLREEDRLPTSVEEVFAGVRERRDKRGAARERPRVIPYYNPEEAYLDSWDPGWRERVAGSGRG